MNSSLPTSGLTENETSLFYTMDHGTLIIRVDGEGTMENGPAMQKFITDLIEIRTIELETVYIDLSKSTYMDSTFIGILLLLNRKLKNRSTFPLTIANANDYARSVLTKTGIDRYLNFEEKNFSLNEDADPISQATLSQLEKARLYYDAHHELCEINEENQKEFSFVVKLLKQEYERLKNSTN